MTDRRSRYSDSVQYQRPLSQSAVLVWFLGGAAEIQGAIRAERERADEAVAASKRADRP